MLQAPPGKNTGYAEYARCSNMIAPRILGCVQYNMAWEFSILSKIGILSAQGNPGSHDW